MQALIAAIALLKSVGLSPNRSNFQPAAVMLATSFNLSDEAATEAKKAGLIEAIKVLKDAFKENSAATIDPLAVLLLASEMARQKADAEDATARAAFEADVEIIHNSRPEYEEAVRNGEPPGDVAIQFVAAMEELLGKPLPGLLQASNQKFMEIQAEAAKLAEKPTLELVPPADQQVEAVQEVAPEPTPEPVVTPEPPAKKQKAS
jgi:hypothetical protein